MTKKGRPLGAAAPVETIDKLLEKYSERHLAKLIGVERKTLHGWRAGGRISQLGLAKLARMFSDEFGTHLEPGDLIASGVGVGRRHHPFVTWLRRNAKALAPAIQVEDDGKRVSVGDCEIVDSALGPEGYERISLVRLDGELTIGPELEAMLNPVQAEFATRLAALPSGTGKKASPVRLSRSLSDEWWPTLDYCVVDWTISKAFYDIVEANPKFRQMVLPSAFDLHSDSGRGIPGILCAHTVIVGVATRGGGCQGHMKALISHRAYRRGSFYGGQWSFSCEEQFAPEGSFWGGRHHSADVSLEGCVKRGLREEYLGDSFGGRIDVRPHAFFINRQSLNLELLSVATLPGTTMKGIMRRWKSGEPVDQAEHDALGTVKITREALRAALQGKGPGAVLEDYNGASRERHAKDKWHPSSLIRIACCLWLLESGAFESEQQRRAARRIPDGSQTGQR